MSLPHFCSVFHSSRVLCVLMFCYLVVVVQSELSSSPSSCRELVTLVSFFFFFLGAWRVAFALVDLEYYRKKMNVPNRKNIKVVLFSCVILTQQAVMHLLKNKTWLLIFIFLFYYERFGSIFFPQTTPRQSQDSTKILATTSNPA